MNQSWNYNFESHSQPAPPRCWRRSGVNQSWNYNFESHSQQISTSPAILQRCESVLKLQFWKPFTTLDYYSYSNISVWISPEITILKAIHNCCRLKMNSSMVWISPEITILKAIHNRVDCIKIMVWGVNQSWNYNFESHSQHSINCFNNSGRCESVLKLQFWKPFTTRVVWAFDFNRCESVLKLQFWKPFTTLNWGESAKVKVWISPEITILKAIHNYGYANEVF